MTSSATKEEKINFVKKEIFDKTINGYMVGDIRRLLTIKVIDNYSGNCNFPIALYVFSCMDFLGYLIAETEYSLNGDTDKRINEYISVMFSEEAKKEIEPHKNEFIDKFRHGLTHEFFPKMSGISRANSELITKSIEGYWVLDADVIANMFIKSVENLSTLESNETVLQRIYNRYYKIQEKNKPLRDVSTFTSTTARASMATTTTVPPELIRGMEDLNEDKNDNFSKGDTGVAGLSKLK